LTLYVLTLMSLKAAVDALFRTLMEAVTQQTVRDLNLPRVSPDALGRAFVHRSTRAAENNERLEFLGDSVIQLVISKYLYQRYAGVSEGVMTKRRSRLVCGRVMAEIGLKIGLGRFVVLGPAHENKRWSEEVLEDAFEAVVAVVFLEAGYDEAEKWVVSVYEANVNIPELLSDEIEHKDRLIKYFSRTGRPAPEFVVLGGGAAGFRASVRSGRSNVLGVGSGRTRRAAENDAARNAFKYLSG
jgi:ribonuclease-3